MQSDWLRPNLPRLIIGSMLKRLRYLPLAVALCTSLMPNSGHAQSASASLPTVARLHYDGGGDWYANPTALPNLIRFCNENIDTEIEPRPQTVEVGNSEIFQFPFLHMTGHGNVFFTQDEANNLRTYLLSGGFLHIDDNYGLDKFVKLEMKKVFPELEFVELPYDHPIYHQKYHFNEGLPKVHEHDGKPSHDRTHFAQTEQDKAFVQEMGGLYVIGTEQVKGFAITLICGILASMFTALFVTKTILGWLIDKGVVTQEELEARVRDITLAVGQATQPTRD